MDLNELRDAVGSVVDEVVWRLYLTSYEVGKNCFEDGIDASEKSVKLGKEFFESPEEYLAGLKGEVAVLIADQMANGEFDKLKHIDASKIAATIDLSNLEVKTNEMNSVVSLESLGR